jgi:hypothetical protein
MTDVGRGPEVSQIPIPGTKRVLKAEGESVTMDGAAGSFWLRMIRDGSVEQIQQPAAMPAAEGEN